MNVFFMTAIAPIVIVPPPLPPMTHSGYFMSGKALFDRCERGAYDPLCLGYIAAIIDHITLIESAPGAAKHFCIPEATNGPDIIDQVQKSLRENPASRHAPAPLVVNNALVKAYPCPNK